jgi:hypothetical protein
MPLHLSVGLLQGPDEHRVEAVRQPRQSVAAPLAYGKARGSIDRYLTCTSLCALRKGLYSQSLLAAMAAHRVTSTGRPFSKADMMVHHQSRADVGVPFL